MAGKKDSKRKDSGRGRKSGSGKSTGKSVPPVPTAQVSAAELFALPPGPVDLSGLDTVGSAGPKDKEAAAEAMAALTPRLAQLQERLFAQSRGGDRQRVLLVLQGMDTAGKDGVIENVAGMMNPAGLQLVSFKKPTAEELAHDFLWRIEKATPGAGMIGVFNRSQYEDVLVVRVHELVPRAIWSRRYAAINAFERRLARQGTVIVKCFLHVSKQVQKERLAARLEDPTKYWKYNPGDVDERGHWDAYQAAYADALRRCDTTPAPWYVIPSDRKWYRNWAVAALLTQALERIDPQYPPASFDLETERARVADC